MNRFIRALLVFTLLFLSNTFPVVAQESVDVVFDSMLRHEVNQLSVLHRGAPALGPKNVTVVSFFASWCPPCHAEFKHLNAVTQEYPDDVEIIAINVFEAWDDNDKQRMATFLHDTDPRFLVVEGNERIRQRFGDVARIPTVFIFGADGVPVLHFIHERDSKTTHVSASDLRAAVAQALAQ